MTQPYELGDCPACGGDTADQIASAEELRAELELLWEFHTRRIRPDTPHRQLTDRLVFSQRPALRLARCSTCGTLYRNPRERGIEQIYEGEAVEPDVMDRLFESQRDAYRAQAERFARVAGRPGRGLEVGSYVGGYLAAVRDHGWTFNGIDVNEAAVRFACSRGLNARVGTLESLDGDERFDAVAIWNCLDQLPEPRAAIAAAHGVLRNGGTFAARIPSGAFYARVREWLATPLGPVGRALLAYNNLLGFPYRTGFTPASLTRVLRDEGFDVVRVHGDTLVQLADAWTRPWAAAEERTLKAALRLLARRHMAPWFEVYARRRQSTT